MPFSLNVYLQNNPAVVEQSLIKADSQQTIYMPNKAEV